jgi:hypothetical protein
MIRFLSLCALLVAFAIPASADPVRLGKLLRMDDFVAIMREEGLKFGAELGEGMLPSGGGALWAARVSRLYDLEVLRRAVGEVFQTTMDPAHSPEAVNFFGSDLGQRLIAGELEARRAILDPDVDEAAQVAAETLPAERAKVLQDFIAVNELVEYNVVGGMTAQVRFYQGLAQGGQLDLSEEDIMAEVWSMEEELRSETHRWLMGYLMLSFEDLNDADITAYTDFSRTAAGRAVNRAIFQAYDRMYADLSLALGLAIADMSMAEQL